MPQNVLEHTIIFLVKKNLLTINPPEHNVVNICLAFYSGSTRHILSPPYTAEETGDGSLSPVQKKILETENRPLSPPQSPSPPVSFILIIYLIYMYFKFIKIEAHSLPLLAAENEPR
jgi:hypothetical protein